jgi:predicted HTH transcriptional regulator
MLFVARFRRKGLQKGVTDKTDVRPGKSSGKTPGKALGKTPGKTPDAILWFLKEKPVLSIPELADKIGKSASAVERAVRKLRQAGRLKRIGPAKGGHWEIIRD